MSERDADDDVDDLEEKDIGIDDLEDDDDLPAEEENPDALTDDELPDPKTPPARQPGRKEREVIKLRKRAQQSEREKRELRERLANLEGRTEVLSRTPIQPAQTAEQERQERERLEAMTPAEQIEYKLSKERNAIVAGMNQREFALNDRFDKSDFRSVCRENPAYASVKDEVEEELAKMRRQGFNANREDVADRLLGKRAAAKAARTAAAGNGAGRTRQKTSSPRSDVGEGGGGRSRTAQPKTARERLEALEAKGIGLAQAHRRTSQG